MLTNMVRALLGIPATLVANFRFLPWRQALRLPILCSGHVSIRGGGAIAIAGPIRPAMVRLGFGDVGVIPPGRMLVDVQDGGLICFSGRCHINYSCRVVVRGTLTIGANVVVQPRTSIIAWKAVEIGPDSLISWDCQILDTDFHILRDAATGTVFNADAPIRLGAHIWLGTRVQILKNVAIAKGCVVGAGSIVTGDFAVPNSLIAGVPAKVIRSDIAWEA